MLAISVASLVQGLMGRCCGCGKNKEVLVFTAESSVISYVNWVNGVTSEAKVKAANHATIDTAGDAHTKKMSAYYRK